MDGRAGQLQGRTQRSLLQIMKREYSKAMRAKGWTAPALAERWGITKAGIYKISGQPTQRDWDALAGLPDRTKPEQGG